jgi:hypothetical protein
MNIKIIFGLIILVLVLGFGFSAISQKTQDIPSWIHEVSWSGKPENATKIEELLWAEIIPYRSEYERVNISSSPEGNGLHLKILASINESDRFDIYDFVYDNEKLLPTGYLLEAIPPMYRNEAIGIALQNQSLASSITDARNPSVKRILPQTSEKYYAPKTLLSVRWKGTSALVDPDERKVVQIWKEGPTK